MPFLKRLESLLSRWAIPNITVIIIAGQAMLYVLQRTQGQQGDPLAKIVLHPGMVLQGEIWRLVTFAFVPPNAAFLFVAIQWMLFYLFGSSLEQHWGTVRYNAFLFIGLVANILAAFIAWGLDSPTIASNGFLYGTVFLAFARLFPNFTIHLFFVLPIQIKWLALLAWIGYGYSLIVSDWMGRMLVVASVANYLLFFGKEHWRDVKQGHRRRAYQAKTSSASKPLVHKCLLCGLDSETSPKTLFRYCSKCDGQCCYCPEHIHDHEHVTSESGDSVESDNELADSHQS